MTCFHLHDENDQHTGSVCAPGAVDYLPRLHRRGSQKWEPIGKPVATIAEAFIVLGAELERVRPRHDHNRADILAVERELSYYDPRQVYEVTVR